MEANAAMKIKPGDSVDFVYEGVRMNGYVSCIQHFSDGSLYFDIKCDGGMEFNRIPCYRVLPANHPEEKFFFDTDMAAKFNTKLYDGSHMKDILNKYYGYYGGYRDEEKHRKSIKVYKTEITGGERRGLYTTVIFSHGKPVVVKKDADAANDILIAIAYANAKRIGSNSHFKKRVDKNTVKIGKDYVVNLWSGFFVPGEILKRKRWDIYTFVAVQELFREFSTKDIIDAIDNVTYTVKEK